MKDINSIPYRQRAFVLEYLKDPTNATAAAIKAGYSKKTARNIAANLLTKVHIRTLIEQKVNKPLEKLEISADRVILELARIAFADSAKLYDDEGNLKHIKDLDEHTRAAVSAVEMEDYVTKGKKGNITKSKPKKIKMTDKSSSLNLLGKYYKLFTDRVEHTGKIKFTSPMVTEKILDLMTADQLDKLKETVVNDMTNGDDNETAGNNPS